MVTALKIFSWIAVVLGISAIIFSEGEYYSLAGGGLFLTEGILALSYITQQERDRGVA